MKGLSSVAEGLGLSPKAPRAPQITQEQKQTPTIDESRARVETRDEMLRKRGRRATILTGPGGVQNAGNVQRKTLIGN